MKTKSEIKALRRQAKELLDKVSEAIVADQSIAPNTREGILLAYLQGDVLSHLHSARHGLHYCWVLAPEDALAPEDTTHD
jgi:hypothetical protein